MIFSGLFFKAFAISGTNSVPWSQPALKGVAKQRAVKFAEYFNCYTPNDWPQTIECLRNIPAINITASLYDFYVSIIGRSLTLCCFCYGFFSNTLGFRYGPQNSIYTSC